MDLDLDEYTKFHSPSYVIEIYNNGAYEEIIIGNRKNSPTVRHCDAETLYDIASLTKIYTATLIYIACEEGKLDIYGRVKDIDNRFTRLDNVRVIDLLSHNQKLWTDGYLGDAKSREDFYSTLFSARVKSNFPTYADTHYMILSALLEKIYNQPFDEILEEKIFRKLKLNKTTTDPRGDNIASNDRGAKPGLVHDPKARAGKSFGITTGHASIFTTARELLTFLRTFLDCTLLSQETINLMLAHDDRNAANYNLLRNLVPGGNINEMYQKAIAANPGLQLLRTYNNMGVRYRNNIDALNDVPANSSDNTVVFSGYTGPSILIDFDRKIIIVVMCNVLYGTKLTRSERKQTTDQIVDEIYSKTWSSIVHPTVTVFPKEGSKI